jgi:glutamine amidotransferase
MSGRFPATVDFCLEEFARHGGMTGPHSDGWGIAYYAQDGGVRMFKEPEPASGSDWIEFIEQRHMRASIVLSHIRRATQGERCLRNTQPFRRELGGRLHVFGHNGDLAGIAADPSFPLGCHRPVGETDSEHAFCALLNRLQKPWLSVTAIPPFPHRLAIVARFARDLRRLGMANFVYTDGDAVFVHGDRRRSSPGEAPRPPGLHVLQRSCGPEPSRFCADGLRIHVPAGQQEMTLVASVPLTGENWKPLGPGEVLALRGGSVEARVSPDADLESMW